MRVANPLGNCFTKLLIDKVLPVVYSLQLLQRQALPTVMMTRQAITWPLLAVSLLFQVLVFGTASNDSLLWGPYRPNLYFGIRPRIPQTLSTALLWSRVEDFQTVQQSHSSHL